MATRKRKVLTTVPEACQQASPQATLDEAARRLAEILIEQWEDEQLTQHRNIATNRDARSRRKRFGAHPPRALR